MPANPALINYPLRYLLTTAVQLNLLQPQEPPGKGVSRLGRVFPTLTGRIWTNVLYLANVIHINTLTLLVPLPALSPVFVLFVVIIGIIYFVHVLRSISPITIIALWTHRVLHRTGSGTD